MPDIINLLPDSVANQIAAGEVIQRPASVVKELIENAVDAGSTSITVNLTDAGKTLIQVVDNGYGMSETDARMAFERHATSKIDKAEDLFAIRTMGFRGEALASIAAIAQVSLKTRQPDNELGTELVIAGTDVKSQENVHCSPGSNFQVKNLFFNIPVRRKFLKSNTTELKHIINEFQRVVLTRPEISFILTHNNSEIYNLPVENHTKRIARLFRKILAQSLIKIDTKTSIIKISGYIGKPESARKNSGEQFFFVNNRYMRHPYFYKAVSMAYDKLLPHDTFPSFFIYFDIDPEAIDVNIHPTKTEIKFEDEANIWKIINIAVKESLGKFNVTPSIDFDTKHRINIPVLRKDTEIRPPEVKVDPTFNPFEKDHKKQSPSNQKDSKAETGDSLENWDKLYEGFEKQKDEPKIVFQSELDNTLNHTEDKVKVEAVSFQLKNKYILTSVKSGLMVIDQKRAHERILFERFRYQLENRKGISQKSLFPEPLTLEAGQAVLLDEINPTLTDLGFEIQKTGNCNYEIHACPADAKMQHVCEMIEKILELYQESESELKIENHDKIALAMAKTSSIGPEKKLSIDEMQELVDSLFACKLPNYTPDGKSVLSIISIDNIDALF